MCGNFLCPNDLIIAGLAASSTLPGLVWLKNSLTSKFKSVKVSPKGANHALPVDNPESARGVQRSLEE